MKTSFIIQSLFTNIYHAKENWFYLVPQYMRKDQTWHKKNMFVGLSNIKQSKP